MGVVPPHRRRAARALGSRVGRLGLAAVLVGVLVSGASGDARPVAGATAPRCAYADTLTRYHARTDWYRSLLDSRYRVSGTYAPLDLVPVTRSGATGRGSVRRIALADLTAMFRAARAAGASFAVQSAYRSYSTQVSTFNHWVLVDGYASALIGSARPGHSEHQLGTALDLKTPGGPEPWDVADWGQTRAGAWLARNSWRYGWVLSYPKYKASLTCYQYEPWHFRYLGRTIAARIRSSQLVARQWLYVKGATGTWIGGAPYPTPTPAPTPTPTPTPSPSDSPGESSSPSSDPSSSVEPTPSPDPSSSVEPTPSAEPSDAGAASASPSDGPGGSPAGEPTPDPASS